MMLITTGRAVGRVLLQHADNGFVRLVERAAELRHDLLDNRLALAGDDALDRLGAHVELGERNAAPALQRRAILVVVRGERPAVARHVAGHRLDVDVARALVLVGDVLRADLAHHVRLFGAVADRFDLVKVGAVLLRRLDERQTGKRRRRQQMRALATRAADGAQRAL
jgi:hypothetical protein